MTYEEFLATWNHALRESRLPAIGWGEQSLDTVSLVRSYKTAVEPDSGQLAEPFHVTARFRWQWDALLTERTLLCEEEVVTTMLGRSSAARLRTEKPWLRVDVTLVASMPYDKPMVMPVRAAWQRWARESLHRLDEIEPVIAQPSARKNRRGGLEILAWQGDPKVGALCNDDGELMLDSIEFAAWQSIEIPRQWDDSGRKPDAPPNAALAALFKRVRASLYAWMESLDHLTAASGRAVRKK